MRLRNRIAPWVLLVAYLPMLVVLSLHTHHDNAPAATKCPDCVHHVSHSGHMSEASATAHPCLVCQVVDSLHYFAPQHVGISAAEQCQTIGMPPATDIVVEAHPYARLRAPPIC